MYDGVMWILYTATYCASLRTRVYVTSHQTPILDPLLFDYKHLLTYHAEHHVYVLRSQAKPEPPTYSLHCRPSLIMSTHQYLERPPSSSATSPSCSPQWMIGSTLDPYTHNVVLRVLKSSATLAIPHRRWLTRKRIRAGIQRLTTLQLTSQRTHSFAKLPRELRDEIL